MPGVQVLAYRLPSLTYDIPHIIGRSLIAETVVTFKCFLDHLGLGTNTSIVEVHDVGTGSVTILDVIPEIMI